MIDVSFDFTTDSYKYWDGFWDRKDGLVKLWIKIAKDMKVVTSIY